MISTRTWYGAVRPKFLVFSRNINVTKQKGCLYLRVAEQLNIQDKINKIYKLYGDCAIQGEIVGPKIQGNKYELGTLAFKAFNGVLKNTGRLAYKEFWEACELAGIEYVPVLIKDLSFAGQTVETMVKLATRKSTLADVPAEGVVIRSQDMLTSFKVINPEFLVKYDA
jgi:ATP-dependent RNA circularization protein (DNA/RNA ligase family)